MENKQSKITYKMALNILGLKDGYTEEELKKTYRNLAKNCHPDLFANRSEREKKEAEDKMPEINEAYEVLKKYLEKTTPDRGYFHNENSAFEIEKYKKELISKLKSYCSTNPNAETRGTNGLIEFDIFLFKQVISITINKEIIFASYQKTLNEILDLFKRLEAEFYEKYNIDTTIIQEKLNYDCSLDDFYEQLLKIKNKYSKEVIFKNQLEEETEKYKAYPKYDRLKVLIDICKNRAAYDAKNSGYDNTEDIINKMHEDILGVFDIYFDLAKKISSYEVEVATIKSDSIKEELEQIKKHFEEGVSFNYTQMELEHLEELIDKYYEEEKRKARLMEFAPAVNFLYQTLINRASGVLNKLNITTDYQRISQVNRTVKSVLELFQKYNLEVIELSSLMLLEKITFDNFNEDIKVINSVGNNLSAFQTSNIYVKRADKCSYIGDNSSFCYLEEIEGKLFLHKKYTTLCIDVKELTLEELQADYISLDEILDKGEFAGEYATFLFSSVLILYFYDNYIIYLDKNDNIRVSVNGAFKPYKVEEDDLLLNEYRDKEYVKSIIVAQIEKEMAKEENNKDPKR